MAYRTFPNLRTYFDDTPDTQEKMAARLGISQSYMSRIVNNLQEPSIELALLICKKAHVPLESLIRKGRPEETDISCV